MFTHESDFLLELSYIALRRDSAKTNSDAVLSVFFCFCCNVRDNLASYCTCALWKYFSNSYF